MIILENQDISVSFSAKGAELQSLLNKNTGIEHLWSGDSKFWGKHSPVLFPVIGGLKSDQYYIGEKVYNLCRHGFAREKLFTISQQTKTLIRFTLLHDQETKKVYPFDFIFSLEYTLENGGLSCKYIVENPSDKEILFSVGGHPAFAVPYTADASFEDHYLEFPRDIKLDRWKLDAGLVSDSSVILPLAEQQLDLNHELFYSDAIVLKNLQSREIKLANRKNNHGLVFSFDNFPFFGIWSAKDAPFVCLEPWCGVADPVNTNQQLADKEGIIKLGAGEIFERTWTVRLF